MIATLEYCKPLSVTIQLRKFFNCLSYFQEIVVCEKSAPILNVCILANVIIVAVVGSTNSYPVSFSSMAGILTRSRLSKGLVGNTPHFCAILFSWNWINLFINQQFLSHGHFSLRKLTLSFSPVICSMRCTILPVQRWCNLSSSINGKIVRV